MEVADGCVHDVDPQGHAHKNKNNASSEKAKAKVMVEVEAERVNRVNPQGGSQIKGQCCDFMFVIYDEGASPQKLV